MKKNTPLNDFETVSLIEGDLNDFETVSLIVIEADGN